MLTSEFDFTLPDELIAQHPVTPRDASRLMVVDRRAGTIAHRHFDELPEILDSRDLLVRNNSQVLPARLIGRRAATEGKWEGLFLDARPDGSWEILAKTRRLLLELHAESPYDVLNAEVRWSGLSHEQTLDSLRRLMEDVAPMLKRSALSSP